MLTPQDIATMQADLAGLAGDAERPITYRRYTSTTPGDSVLGIQAADHYDDEPSTATMRDLTLEEIQTSAGVYLIGDREFGVRRPAVDARDKIVYGGATWRIIEVGQAALGGTVLKHTLRCRKL